MHLYQKNHAHRPYYVKLDNQVSKPPREEDFSTYEEYLGDFWKHLTKQKSVATAYTSVQMAQFYNFPKVTGPQQTIYLIELGGGYDPTSLNKLVNSWGMPNLDISDLSISGAKNSYTGDPNSADVEVELDIICAVGAYWYSTGQVPKIVVVFCPNTDSGFVAGVTAVGKIGNCTCGISWGSSEANWAAASIVAMDAAFQAGCANGVTYCVASGDNLDSDGSSGLNCDYPASSPWVCACGGTTITVSGNTITMELPWNSGNDEGTGGGYSVVEKLPSYQASVPVLLQKGVRGSPDLVAAGDPASGWITPFGPVGGTSAVAPFASALFAVYNAALGKAVGLPNAVMYNNINCFNDVTSGNNTAKALPRYPALVGWDAASGLGSPKATLLLAALQGGSVPPPPVQPPPVQPPPVQPPPTVPPSTGPTLAQVDALVKKVFASNQSGNRIIDRWLARCENSLVASLPQLWSGTAPTAPPSGPGRHHTLGDGKLLGELLNDLPELLTFLQGLGLGKGSGL